MEHIDEYNLELYVLNDMQIEAMRDKIEEHLLECYGCRALVDEMNTYYKELEIELQRKPEPIPSIETAIVRRHTNLTQFYKRPLPPIQYPSNTPFAKIFYFARRHPMVVSAGGFAAIAALGWFMNDAIRNLSTEKIVEETNPVNYIYNTGSNFIEVVDSKNKRLWNLATGCPDLNVEKDREQTGHYYRTKLEDLNGEGKNELVTILPLMGEKRNNLIRIFAFDGKLIASRDFDTKVAYKGNSYKSDYALGNLIVDSFSSNKHKEIFVTTQVEQSLSSLTRIDIQGRTIGEYWHYGTVNASVLNAYQSSKKYIILCGKNDVQENTSNSFPIIIILDPVKIIGKSESSVSPGFGFDRSAAELYCIRLLPSDGTSEQNGDYYVDYFDEGMGGDKDALSFWIKSIRSDASIRYEYIFSRDMKLLNIKSPMGLNKSNERLANKGSSVHKAVTLDQQNLKNGVRYWDGKEWRKEWTKVKNIVLNR
jgi:hypothetical protein